MRECQENVASGDSCGEGSQNDHERENFLIDVS